MNIYIYTISYALKFHHQRTKIYFGQRKSLIISADFSPQIPQKWLLRNTLGRLFISGVSGPADHAVISDHRVRHQTARAGRVVEQQA